MTFRAIVRANLSGPAPKTVFVCALLPLMVMIWQIATNALGPDPAEPLMQGTGEWALRLLVLVLLARPASRLGWSLLFRHRRMLGLFTFFYATVHLLLFAQVYIAWSAPILVEELAERPYVIVGASAWLLLLPLAIPLPTPCAGHLNSAGASFTGLPMAWRCWGFYICCGCRDLILAHP